jgi:adenylate cyclase
MPCRWKTDETPMIVELAREQRFALGALEVRPPTREVVAAGLARVLEPRVMQVLVALARRRGEVVSRDELIAACWSGRTVGEDAINRCIAALRRLSDSLGEFSVETIARVGYRLTPRADRAPDPTPAVAPAPAAPLLAVLAFDNLSGDPEMTWFSDGVSEEILQTVARAAALKVIGRGSSFQFRGADKSAARVAEALRATHVLDGSVRRSGEQVRVSAHLIECASETTLWSDRFDRDLSDVFALQDEIAAAVTAALRVLFAPAPKPEPIDPAAYDLYLKSLDLRLARLGSPERSAAVGLLEQATALAPRFARAWAALARELAHLMLFAVSDLAPSVLRARVVAAAEQALQLDPGLGGVYQTLSVLEPRGHYAQREALHRKALAISPNDPEVLALAGWYYSEIGRRHDAFEYARQAFVLDPTNHSAASWYASLLSAEGRYHESRLLYDSFRTTWPKSAVFVTDGIIHAGANADWAEFDRVVALARERGMLDENLAGLVGFWSAVRDPHRDAAAAHARHAREMLARTGAVSLEILFSLYLLGMRDAAFDLIDNASFAYMFDPDERRGVGLLSQNIIFSMAHGGGIVGDPRFPRLCAKLGLCDHWVRTGCWPDCADQVSYDFRAECRRLVSA